jgi:hypothetical protein
MDQGRNVAFGEEVVAVVRRMTADSGILYYSG